MPKKKKRGKRQFTLPLAVLGGLAAGLVEPAVKVMEGSYESAVHKVVHNYTGYSIGAKRWEPEGLMRGLVPLLIGAAVHKYVGGPPMNVNRMLASANVPIIRI